MEYFVYIYNSPEGVAYYVGEGQKGRYFCGHNVPVPRNHEQVQIFKCDSKDECVAIESELIAFFGRQIDGGTLMNLATGPGGTGTVRTKEYREKMSKALTGRQFTDDHRRKIGEANSRRVVSNETRDRMSKRYHDPVQLVSPTGEVFTVQNISKFARDRGLPTSTFSAMALGKCVMCEGWRRIDAVYKNRNFNRDPVVFISPDGDSVVVTNAAQHCRDHGLNLAHFCAVARGERRHHKGWKLEGVDQALRQPRNYQDNPVHLLSPQGDVYEVTSLRAHANEFDLSAKSLSALVYKQQSSHRGWTLASA